MEQDQRTHDPRKTHLAYGDPLRVIATLCVIALHSSAVRVVNIKEIVSVGWLSANIIDSCCRWAVPVFVMLSGALLLAKQESVAGFYGKRFARVGIPLLVWVPLYYLWAYWTQEEQVTLDFIKTSLWQGMLHNHLYFLFIIAGLYVITPLLRLLVRRAPAYVVWLVAGAVFVLTVTGNVYEYVPMMALTRFIPYIGYFLLGYLLRTAFPTRGWTLFYAILWALVSAIIAWRTTLLILAHGQDDWRSFALYDHMHVAVIAQSVCIFLLSQGLFTQETPRRIQRLAAFLGPLALGAYLMHFAVLYHVRSWTYAIPDAWTGGTVVLETLVVFSVCVFLSYLVSKVPVLRSTIGL